MQSCLPPPPTPLPTRPLLLAPLGWILDGGSKSQLKSGIIGSAKIKNVTLNSRDPLHVDYCFFKAPAHTLFYYHVWVLCLASE
jgi:hypothetical protein